jgi:VWFA-related protein
VALYAIDPRGLEIPCGADSDNSLHSCYLTASNTHDALHYISGETGGFAVVNTSNLGGGLERILHDQQGYYVIGYQPDSDTFGDGTDPKYHKVTVKVKKKGLKVRSRQGFYAVPTD